MTTNVYEDHQAWTQHLAELGCLKESHNVCLLADTCIAEDDDGEG